MTSAQDLQLASAAFARIRNLEQRGMPDAADLPEIFADLFADHGGASTVEIMTIHKAKGLEFDMVVLPALDRAVPPDRNQLLLSHQFARTGRDGMVMAARPPVGTRADLLFEFLRYQRRDAAVLEAQRLLYVACTRAKCQLRLTAVVDRLKMPTTSDEAVPRRAFRPPAGSLLRALWPVLGRRIRSADGAASTTGPAADGERRAAGRSSACHWTGRRTRDSAPLAAAASSSPPRGTRRRSSTGPVKPRGVSAAWCTPNFRRWISPIATRRRSSAREAHFRRWLALHGVPEESIAGRRPRASWRRCSACIATRAAGGYCSKAFARTCANTPCRGTGRGNFSRVVFDRSFIDDAGVRWVIDYKTSQHLGGGLELFLDREVERYRSQLERYGRLARRLGPEPVRLGLYFPLMRAWREWVCPKPID